jgi:hypothetical protein
MYCNLHRGKETEWCASRKAQLVCPCHQWAVAADDLHSYQLRRISASAQAISNTGQLRSGQTSPGPTNPSCWWQSQDFTLVHGPILPGFISTSWWCTAVQSAETSWCHYVNMDHNSTPFSCRIHAPNNSDCSGGKEGSDPEQDSCT